MAEQVGVPAGDLAGYDWVGRSIKYHRAQVREAFCFRESTVADEQRWARWLQDEVYPVELSEDRVRDALLRRCRPTISISVLISGWAPRSRIARPCARRRRASIARSSISEVSAKTRSLR